MRLKGYVVGMQWYEKIRAQRESLGLSQADLAREVRISQAAIHKIERGGVLKSRFLPRIALRLGLEVSDLDPDYPAWGAKKHQTIYKNFAESTNTEVTAGVFSKVEILEDDGDTDLLSTCERSDGTVLISHHSLGKITRPKHLQGVSSLTALLVDGIRMRPEISSGDIVFGSAIFGPIEDATCVFVSRRYSLPEARLGRICRVTQVLENGWNTFQYNYGSGEEGSDLLTTDDWHLEWVILAKYYKSNLDYNRRSVSKFPSSAIKLTLT